MDIQFFDNSDLVPQPKDKIKIESLEATPYPDRSRVFVEIKVTPFQVRPNLILVATDDDNRTVADLSIIETMHSNMEFTLHIRNKPDPAGQYQLVAELFYETRNPPQDRKTVNFDIPAAEDE